MRNRLSRSMQREARDFHRNFQSRLQSCTAIFDIEVCRRSVINLLFSQFSFESNDTFFFLSLSLFRRQNIMQFFGKYKKYHAICIKRI